MTEAQTTAASSTTRRSSRLHFIVNVLLNGLLLFLFVPLCIAALIELDAWPMIAVAAVWFPIVARFGPFIFDRAWKWRGRKSGRIAPSSALELTITVVVFYALVLAPGFFAGFYYGPLQGEATAILIIALAPIYGWFSHRAWRKKQAIRAAEEEAIRKWKCPQCGETYGTESAVSRFEATFPKEHTGEVVTSYALAHCAKCDYMHTFDAAGAVLLSWIHDPNFDVADERRE